VVYIRSTFGATNHGTLSSEKRKLRPTNSIVSSPSSFLCIETQMSSFAVDLVEDDVEQQRELFLYKFKDVSREVINAELAVRVFFKVLRFHGI